MTSLTCESGGWDMTRAQTKCSLQPLSDACTGQLEDTFIGYVNARGKSTDWAQGENYTAEIVLFSFLIRSYLFMWITLRPGHILKVLDPQWVRGLLDEGVTPSPSGPHSEFQSPEFSTQKDLSSLRACIAPFTRRYSWGHWVLLEWAPLGARSGQLDVGQECRCAHLWGCLRCRTEPQWKDKMDRGRRPTLLISCVLECSWGADNFKCEPGPSRL